VLTAQETFNNVAYSSTGHLLFVRGGTLFAQRFDTKRLALAGEPITIAEHLAHDAGTGAMYSISKTGVLIYRKESVPVVSQLGWLDRSGGKIGAIGDASIQAGVTLSPDGSRAAVSRQPQAMVSGDIWILSTATGAASRLTFDTGHFSPVWSPDGREVAFGTQRHATDGMVIGVFRQPASGAGQRNAVVSGAYTTFPTDWSHDGRFMIYSDQDTTTKSDLWVLPLAGDHKPIPLVRTAAFEAFGQLSPDERWLAYTSDVSGREEVYVQAFPTAQGKWQVSTRGGTQPRWRQDGKELFYASAQRQMIAVAVAPGVEGLDLSVQKPLFTHDAFGKDDYTYAVSADGQRFLVNAAVSDPSQPIVVVLNWAAGLK